MKGEGVNECLMCGEPVDPALARWLSCFAMPSLCSFDCIHLAAELHAVELKDLPAFPKGDTARGDRTEGR